VSDLPAFSLAQAQTIARSLLLVLQSYVKLLLSSLNIQRHAARLQPCRPHALHLIFPSPLVSRASRSLPDGTTQDTEALKKMKLLLKPLPRVAPAAMGRFPCPAKLRFGEAGPSPSITGKTQKPPDQPREEAMGRSLSLLLTQQLSRLLLSRLRTCKCLERQTVTRRGGWTGCTGTTALCAASRQPRGHPLPTPPQKHGPARRAARAPHLAGEVPAGRILPPRVLPSTSVRKRLPGRCLSSVFQLPRQVPSLQPWPGLSKSECRYLGMGKRDTSLDQCSWAGNWELRVKPSAEQGAHPRAGWDGLSSQGQNRGSAVLRVPAGNAGKMSQSWSLGLGTGGQAPAGNWGPGSGWEQAASRRRWLWRGCSPGRWCAW